MALTKEFKDTVMELCKDPEYRKCLLQEAIEAYLNGETLVGNSLMRDYMNGTQAFERIAKEMQMKVSGLRRMVGPKGNGTITNIGRLIKICKDAEGLELQAA